MVGKINYSDYACIEMNKNKMNKYVEDESTFKQWIENYVIFFYCRNIEFETIL